MSLIFYTNPQSRGRIVRWALEEIGQPYETRIIPYGAEMKGSYAAVNPMGKVPALEHDGEIVTESAAIVTYLADAFPQAGLAPAPGSRERAPYYRWLFFAAGPLESAMFNAAMKFEVPPERTVAAGYGSMALVLRTLEQALSTGPYVLKSGFSAADIYLGSQLMFATRFKWIEPNAVFTTYIEHLAARPAARRAVEIDDALVPQPA